MIVCSENDTERNCLLFFYKLHFLSIVFIAFFITFDSYILTRWAEIRTPCFIHFGFKCRCNPRLCTQFSFVHPFHTWVPPPPNTPSPWPPHQQWWVCRQEWGAKTVSKVWGASSEIKHHQDMRRLKTFVEHIHDWFQLQSTGEGKASHEWRTLFVALNECLRLGKL